MILQKKIWMPPQERNVGYLFQNYALFPTITVEKNIGIALRCGKKEKEKKVRDMIDRFSLQGLGKKNFRGSCQEASSSGRRLRGS